MIKKRSSRLQSAWSSRACSALLSRNKFRYSKTASEEGVFLILTSSNKMVTQAIKKIKEVEKNCQKKLEQARLQTEAIIQDALNRKIELIVQARKETQKTMEELARQAEEDARRESKKIADKEKEEIKKLKEKVKPRFHKSLSRILREMGIQLK